jgi:hypothetical protein
MVKVKKVLELAKQKKRNEKIVAMVDAAAKNEIKEVRFEPRPNSDSFDANRIAMSSRRPSRHARPVPLTRLQRQCWRCASFKGHSLSPTQQIAVSVGKCPPLLTRAG